ncbi:HAD-like protein [Clavulina sp. PMI_390]|nr:HAD-like protein [Clavulina sp. PMI_390]
MVTFSADAILFDMASTLIDSTPGVVAAWHSFAKTYPVDVERVLHESHGVRLVDSLKMFCGITDPEILTKECCRFEDEVIAGGPKILPGVKDLLAQLNAVPETAARWTIVTSATAYYAPPALKMAGIDVPKNIVTSEDVSRGKPFPDPYLEGAKRLGVDPTKVLVVEDAASGIRSGKACGSKTAAVLTSHSREQMLASGAGPDWIIQDLTRMSVQWVDGMIEVTIQDLGSPSPGIFCSRFIIIH